MFTPYRIAFVYSMSTNGPGRYKSFTHIKHSDAAVGGDRVGALNLQSSLLNIYFCLSRFQLSLPLIYFRDRPHRCSYCSKVWLKTYLISDALLSRLVQLGSVTEIAPLEPFLCVNRSPIRYDFRGGVKAIWYSVNIA